MMKIAIASGKGGTGKTLVSTNLARVWSEQGKKIVYLDCDVEEPNGHLFLKPEVTNVEKASIRSPIDINTDACTGCGKCVEACVYNALAVVRNKAMLFRELCHTCGACVLVCPVDAIVEGDREIGELRHGASGDIEFHYALLKTAEGGMSPRLIRRLKAHADAEVVLLDCPPGTACSAVESVKDADLCVLVADPTPFSVHDLRLSVNMCRQIGQEPVVLVNRAGLDDSELMRYCESASLEIIGQIPDDRRIAEVYSVGDLAADKLPDIHEIFEAIARAIEAKAKESRTARKDLIEPIFEQVEQSEREPRAFRTNVAPQEIVVISGKGGTGKTSLTACFSSLATEMVISDCDVDAADLHILLDPQVQEEGGFSGSHNVEIVEERCRGCGWCFEVCRFDAIRAKGKVFEIDALACEGCGACTIVCPADAIEKTDALNGKWFVSETRFGPMTHAMLGFAEENSGRLVTLVRRMAVDVSKETARSRVLIDGSPGTGCPVIASITGASYAVVVTEPTVSGLHDLRRVLDVTKHFGVRTGVIVNKYDLNEDMTQQIEEAAKEANADFLGAIPYDKCFVEAQIQRKSLIEYTDNDVAKEIRSIWDRILSLVK